MAGSRPSAQPDQEPSSRRRLVRAGDDGSSAAPPRVSLDHRGGPASIPSRDSFGDRVFRVIRKRKWIVIAMLVLVPAGLVAWALAQESRYDASATLLLRPPGTGSTFGPGRAADLDRAAATDRELLQLRTVAADAARARGGGFTAEEIEDAVEVELADNADIVHIRAEDGSAERAAQMANAYAEAYIAFRREATGAEFERAIGAVEDELASLAPGDREQADDLRRRRAELRVARAELGDPALVERALPPAQASDRNVVRNGVIGLGIGALLGLGLAWLAERLGRRIKTTDEMEQIYELPVLARIPRSQVLKNKRKKGARGETLTKKLRFSEEAEAFRTLRTNLRYFNVDRQVRSMLVVSPLPGDGKSTIARYLAITMAAMGDKVVLVHADLRKPEPVTQSGEEGLSLVLAGFELDAALTEVPVSFDAVADESRMLVELPTGPVPPNPGELLESARMRWVVAELEKRFDYVIIDSPALGTVSDALSLVPDVSGVLIVSGLERTTRHSAVDLRKQILLLGGRPLGVVANFGTPQKSDYYYSGHDRPRAGASR